MVLSGSCLYHNLRPFLGERYIKLELLNDYPAFEKVLPSKIFEYAATRKPIIAEVSGYAAKFIESAVENAEVFYFGDHESAFKALFNLKSVHTDRASFAGKYTRSRIMKDMSDSIVAKVLK